MGQIGFGRHLRAIAAVSFAALAAACAGGRHEAPVIMKGTAPEQIEMTPITPMRTTPKVAAPRPIPPAGPGRRIVVRPGQSVGYLAHEYGVTKRAIIEANNLTPPEYKIEIGKELIIPGGGEPQPTAQAANVDEPSPAAEHTTAAKRTAKAGEVIPLDDPAPAPKKAAEAPTIQFPAPAASAHGKPSPVGGDLAARSSQPAEKETASAEVEKPSARSGRLPWPVRGRVVAGYGTTKAGGHNAGINIAAARGAPVRAVDGVVAYAGNEIRGYGNLVLVKHPNGLISAYAHLNSLLVSRGDKVSRGQVIAKVGNTGGVSEPQLHFELRRGKKAIDPRELLTPGANAGGNGEKTAG